MAVTKRTRYEVLRRDNHTCRYCGATAPNATLTIDHVTPVALGGTDDPTNLVTACRDCNAGKGSSSPDEATVADIDKRAATWAAAMLRAGDILAETADAREQYVGAFLEAWPQYRYLPDSLISTVERFYDLGLPQNVMVDAAHAAATTKGVYDRPAYFAGICWKRVRAMQDIASQIVNAEDEA